VINLRKYIKVWVEKRRNPPKQDGSRTTSYTLEWVEFGERRFLSLGPGATFAFAKQAAKLKEEELNSLESHQALDPITWDRFREKYLNTQYPGYALSRKDKKEASKTWGNSEATMAEERRVLAVFGETVRPDWCHEVTAEYRERFIQERMRSVSSPSSVDKDLRTLRHLFNVLEDWHHRPKGTNPFAGRGNSTVGAKRKREKDKQRIKPPAYYTRTQVDALLEQANRETAEFPEDWNRQRLRVLIYFEAYTGVRIEEALFLEWSDLDVATGIANINFKVEHDLKTQASENPVGLPDVLIAVLREWETRKTCSWVFPNTRQRPWTGGSPGYKHLDQLKAMAKRAGVLHATWKMFRHTLTTHSKQWFGLTAEQVQAQLRHTTIDTQEHYTHSDKENLHAFVKHIDFHKND